MTQSNGCVITLLVTVSVSSCVLVTPQACLLLLATCSAAMLMWPVNQRSSQLISPHTGRDSTHPASTWTMYMDNTWTESKREGQLIVCVSVV